MSSFRLGKYSLTLRGSPLVMGVLNVTPDSFSDGGRFLNHRAAIEHAHKMAAEGADIIDVGGESTRPGSDMVSATEELARVLPVIEALVRGGDGRPRLPIPISIDTCKPEVAEAALVTGCSMVNDVTAARDSRMVDVMRAHPNAAIVLMHMLGEPKTMQEDPQYAEVVGDVTSELAMRAASLEATGIARERIVLDPGIGFGKTLHHNLELLKHVDAFKELGYPVLVGASRKSFLGTLVHPSSTPAAPEARLYGSLAVAAWCHAHHIEMIRVHDVRETVELLRVLDAIEDPAPHRPKR
ncbi:MAG TPA: dihydropteroate synthase [Candidatus Krumholzibacteria bacterium]|nr:dihydropteroate synthase [Candidatus Krumholzibacteria bacterium]